jgi:hypothetical protein
LQNKIELNIKFGEAKVNTKYGTDFDPRFDDLDLAEDT